MVLNSIQQNQAVAMGCRPTHESYHVVNKKKTQLDLS